MFQSDPRSQLITLVGRNSERTEAQCQEFDISPSNSWEQLVNRDDLDLVVVATVNCDHAAIVQAALSAQKHVIVEYPLALEIAEAKSLIQLAQQQGRLLHVEHIELLGGLHQAIKRVLPEIGPVFHGQYSTLSAKHPAPQKWTYQHSLFGFPLVGALSRLHRWIDLFGQVETVNCHSRFWNTGGENSTSLNTDRYQACLCQAHLQFEMGPTMEIIYGKGEVFWQSENWVSLYGEQGTLKFTPEQGELLTGETSRVLSVEARRGLFQRDTEAVLEHLCTGQALYVTAADSFYTLQVAVAAQHSAALHQPIQVAGIDE